MNLTVSRPPVFGIYDDLLPVENAAQMLEIVLPLEKTFRAATIYKGSGKVVVPEQRSATHIRFPQHEAFEALLLHIRELREDIFNRLGMKPFEVRHHECEVVAHGDGAYFRRHRDTVFNQKGQQDESNRIVSCVYYFGQQPMRFTGGTLKIFSMFDPDHSVAIEPRANRLVVFPSFFFHEVTPIVCHSSQFEDCRFSANIWLRR